MLTLLKPTHEVPCDEHSRMGAWYVFAHIDEDCFVVYLCDLCLMDLVRRWATQGGAEAVKRLTKKRWVMP